MMLVRALVVMACLTAKAAAQTPAAPAAGSGGLAERGAPLDTGGFRYQRPLVEGPVGLAVLPLDPAVLSHSQGPQRQFADVRLVDANDVQIPYILEQRPSRLSQEIPVRKTVSTLGQFVRPGGVSRSFYTIMLPFENLPEPALMVETSEQLFVRTLELGAPRQPDRRHRHAWFDPLARTSWHHANMRTPATPLEIKFPQERGRELLLVVEEGDNQPLPITRLRLLLPAWQLRFIRPAGPLRLLYGRPDIAPPQYDVAMVSSAAMKGAAPEVSAAPEVPPAAPTQWVSPMAFWAGLSLAVVVLIGLIVRLIWSSLRRPSPPAP